MVSRPPSGIASRALTARFRITCSELTRSARTRTACGASSVTISDVLADQAQQHPMHVRDHAVDVDHARLQDLSATVREELLRQRRGSLRRGRDLVEVAADCTVAVAEAPDREPCPACDDREQVVEVVGHTARELAHRFHAMGVAQLLFEVQPLRQILDHDDREARIVLGVHDARGRDLTQTPLIRPSARMSLVSKPFLPSREQRAQRLGPSRGNGRDLGEPSSGELLLPLAEQLLECTIARHDALFEVDDHRPGGGALEHRAEAFFTLAEAREQREGAVDEHKRTEHEREQVGIDEPEQRGDDPQPRQREVGEQRGRGEQPARAHRQLPREAQHRCEVGVVQQNEDERRGDPGCSPAEVSVESGLHERACCGPGRESAQRVVGGVEGRDVPGEPPSGDVRKVLGYGHERDELRRQEDRGRDEEDHGDGEAVIASGGDDQSLGERGAAPQRDEQEPVLAVGRRVREGEECRRDGGAHRDVEEGTGGAG